MDVTLRDSTTEDLEWLVELRAVVLRDDLTRLGVFDETRVRQRLRDAFQPELTRIVVVDDRDVGSVTVRVEDDVRWVEHFYLAPDVQGVESVRPCCAPSSTSPTRVRRGSTCWWAARLADSTNDTASRSTPTTASTCS